MYKVVVHNTGSGFHLSAHFGDVLPALEVVHISDVEIRIALTTS
jgi:hypothetical protein